MSQVTINSSSQSRKIIRFILACMYGLLKDSGYVSIDDGRTAVFLGTHGSD